MSEAKVERRKKPYEEWLLEQPEAVRLISPLYEAGTRMALEIESRWSGPGGCDCSVCQAAKDWRALTARRYARGGVVPNPSVHIHNDYIIPPHGGNNDGGS